MKSISLSPSSISLFLDCPRCFWLQMNKKKRRPGGPFPSLPSGMDKILKVHFDKHREKDETPEELEGKFKGRLYNDLEKLRIWQNNFKGLTYTDKKSGIILRGALDDLFVTADKTYAPLDFKTRGYPLKTDTHEHYQHQMDIYSFLLGKNGLKPAGFAILLFYHPLKVNKNHNVVFQVDDIKVKTSVKNGERLFLDAIKCLRGREPKKGDCLWCNW